MNKQYKAMMYCLSWAIKEYKAADLSAEETALIQIVHYSVMEIDRL